MKLISLAFVAAVLIEGYLAASVNGPSEHSKILVKRQAPGFSSFMPPNMFRPNLGPLGMGAMGLSSMGAMGLPNMGAMGPPNMGAMGLSNQGAMGLPNMGALGLPHMGAMGLSNMGAMGLPNMGAMGPPNMGTMGLSNMGAMGLPFMGLPNMFPPYMFDPANQTFAGPQGSNFTGADLNSTVSG